MNHVDIVAEIGSNWNGDIYTAVQMIAIAKAAGCDHAKFQHYPDTSYGPHPLNRQQLQQLSDYANNLDIGFICSVFDTATLVEYVEACNPGYIKIASPELTHHELLNHAAGYNIPLILSTGISTNTQILQALEIVASHDTPAIWLHCVSAYPAPPAEMNLRAMRAPNGYGRYGLSDHTQHPIAAPVAAVALGATMIEKHLTLDHHQKGPDHAYALEPNELAELVTAVRQTEQMLGNSQKTVTPSEHPELADRERWKAA